MTNTPSAYTEVGNLLAAMLDNPQCPPTVRESIVNHLSGLYARVNLMQPDLVRVLYYHLIAADIAASSPTQSPTDEAAPIATEAELTGEISNHSEENKEISADENDQEDKSEENLADAQAA